ncbi:hypothetical protein Pmar_PMAR001287, partial [Perkinsus marinus ATCC 50983]
SYRPAPAAESPVDLTLNIGSDDSDLRRSELLDPPWNSMTFTESNHAETASHLQ